MVSCDHDKIVVVAYLISITVRWHLMLTALPSFCRLSAVKNIHIKIPQKIDHIASKNPYQYDHRRSIFSPQTSDYGAVRLIFLMINTH